MARRTGKTPKNLKVKRAGPSKTHPKSVGKEILERLERFVNTLETLPPDTTLDKRFTVRTVKLSMPAPVCTAEEVRATRDLIGASQAIFAQFLGVSASAVQDWEQGHKPPRGSACRLMNEIRRDPEYWMQRFAELLKQTT
jgi:putative transcriptional regulator